MTDAGFDLAAHVRDIPDFPKEGILFRDIMPLLQEPRALREAVDRLVEYGTGKHIDVVMGAEARGFILGAAVAYGLGAGFVCARKPGKLPHDDHLRRVRPRVRHRQARGPRRRDQAGAERARARRPPGHRRHGQGQGRARREARRQGRRRRLHHRARRPRRPQEARGLRRLQPDHVLTAQGGRRFAGPPALAAPDRRPARASTPDEPRIRTRCSCRGRSFAVPAASSRVDHRRPRSRRAHLHASAAPAFISIEAAAAHSLREAAGAAVRRCTTTPARTGSREARRTSAVAVVGRRRQCARHDATAAGRRR